jgi:hypothetical protein
MRATSTLLSPVLASPTWLLLSPLVHTVAGEVVTVCVVVVLAAGELASVLGLVVAAVALVLESGFWVVASSDF